MFSTWELSLTIPLIQHLKPAAQAQVSFALETTRLGELLVELDLCDGTGLQAEFSSPESTKAYLCGL